MAHQSSLITWRTSTVPTTWRPNIRSTALDKIEERVRIFSKSFRNNHRQLQASITSTHSRSRHTRYFRNTYTLTDTGTEYQHALNKLDEHFSIKKNVPFERFVFHSTTQHKSESIGQFVTRLRKLTL